MPQPKGMLTSVERNMCGSSRVLGFKGLGFRV